VFRIKRVTRRKRTKTAAIALMTKSPRRRIKTRIRRRRKTRIKRRTRKTMRMATRTISKTPFLERRRMTALAVTTTCL
jgi:hypothetical protein